MPYIYYINIITLEKVTLSGLRRLFPHISFPATGPDADTLASLGYAGVVATDAPTITVTQRIVEGTPELVDGVWRQVWVVEDMTEDEVATALTAAKDAACASLDARAEALRNTVLTPGSGQMASYQTKESQATALLEDAEPSAAKYPDIYNEVGITAETAAGVAQAVLTAAETWRVFGRAVERARLSGKKAVGLAKDVAGVAAAEAGVEWPATG